MEDCFSDVLGAERAALVGSTDELRRARWRDHVVGQVMPRQPPCAVASRQVAGVPGRVRVLRRSCELAAAAVARHRTQGSTGRTPDTPRHQVDDDARDTAVLMLAAVFGGSAPRQVAQDARPPDAALDLAFGRWATTHRSGPESAGGRSPTQ